MDTLETTFEMLPCEMKMKILNQLPIKDKQNARLVCKSWFQNLNNPKKLAFHPKLNDETLKHVKNHTQDFIDSLHVQDLKASILMSTTRLHGLPSASKLILSNGISNSNLIKFLRYYCTCNVVETLELSAYSFGLLEVEEIRQIGLSLNWTHLKCFKLEAISRQSEDILMPNHFTEFAKHVQSLAELLKLVSIPTLTSLSLILDFGNVDVDDISSTTVIHHPFETLYKQLYQFLLRHASYNKLKEFEIHLKGDLGDNISEFEFELNYEPMNLSIVQFETFKLEVETDDHGPFILDLVNVQSKLKYFEVDSNYEFIPWSLSGPITQQLLPRNHATLETVSICGIQHDLSWFSSSCSKLKSLTLLMVNVNNLIVLPTTSVASSLQNIVQFSFTTFSPPATDEIQDTLSWIIKNLPNVEQLELLFGCLNIFTIENVQLLINRLSKLKIISIYEPELDTFDVFCATTIGLSTQRVFKVTEYSEFVYQIKINRHL